MGYNKAMKRVLCLILILSVLCATWVLASCEKTPEFSPSDGAKTDADPAAGSSSSSSSSGSTESAVPSDKSATLDEWARTYTAGNFGIVNRDDPFVVLEIENFGNIRLELFPSYAPNTVENFLRYVNDGFYDGVVFHRVIANFMIQAGGFTERDGVGVQKAATYGNIAGEFVYNGVANYLGHFPGMLSMARSGAITDSAGNVIDTGYDSASSQFFICTARADWLDGQYAAFGRVIDEESMAVALAIEKVQTATTYLYSGSSPHAAENVPVDFPKIKRAYALG